MTDQQKKELLKIIDTIDFGKIIINIQNGKINNIKKEVSIKL